jgi:hypothetical protein
MDASSHKPYNRSTLAFGCYPFIPLVSYDLISAKRASPRSSTEPKEVATALHFEAVCRRRNIATTEQPGVGWIVTVIAAVILTLGRDADGGISAETVLGSKPT